MTKGPEKFKPEIVALYCANGLDPSVDTAAAARSAKGFSVKFAVLPCSSKADISHLLKLLAGGADAVQVIGCPEGECKLLVGSARAEKRVGRGRWLLGQVGLGEERLAMVRAKGMKLEELMGVLEHRANLVRPLGRNPVAREERK